MGWPNPLRPVFIYVFITFTPYAPRHLHPHPASQLYTPMGIGTPEAYPPVLTSPVWAYPHPWLAFAVLSHPILYYGWHYIIFVAVIIGINWNHHRARHC